MCTFRWGEDRPCARGLRWTTGDSHGSTLVSPVYERSTWSEHVPLTTKKGNGTLAFVRRNLKTCPKKIKENAYTTLVRPVLEYGAAKWDPYLGKDISSIEMVQRRAARFITNDYAHTSSVSDVIEELGWHSLDRRSDIRLITSSEPSIN